ncbi:MAG: sugar ABC transporter ATP-binding protein [Thermotogaceae bacterium]|nr:sugar ABC transporter ATP-binding protein [Thermotogaceae bacterium]
MEFSGVRVLHSVDVKFTRGKIYGIVGENGAGKSTLMKIVSGFLQPVEGEIFVYGKKTTLNPLKAKELGIILIPQELNLVDTLRVYENIFLGNEMKSRFLFLDKKKMIEESKRLVKRFGLNISPLQFVYRLSPAQKQLIEIVKAVSKSARLLIMDEPTSALSEREVKNLFNLIRRMKEEGITVIFISHRLKEVKEIADEIIVLRDGRKVYEGRASGLTEKEIAQLMIGRHLSEMYPEKSIPKGEIVLKVENFFSADGSVKNVSFDLRKGEILGFYGLVGSGRTELMETLVGIRRKSAGRVTLHGAEVNITSPDEAKKLGIVYLPEDRKTAGIVPILEVYKNITLMNLEKYSRFLLKKDLEIEAFRRYKEKFSIVSRGPYQLVKTLSGGNQQKVVISKLVDTGARIFIFDEPTRGVDVNAKHQIYHIIRNLIDEFDATFIVVSSELPEIIGISNRVVVMRNGEVAGIVEGEGLNEKNLIYLATGVSEEG